MWHVSIANDEWSGYCNFAQPYAGAIVYVFWPKCEKRSSQLIYFTNSGTFGLGECPLHSCLVLQTQHLIAAGTRSAVIESCVRIDLTFHTPRLSMTIFWVYAKCRQRLTFTHTLTYTMCVGHVCCVAVCYVYRHRLHHNFIDDTLHWMLWLYSIVIFKGW